MRLQTEAAAGSFSEVDRASGSSGAEWDKALESATAQRPGLSLISTFAAADVGSAPEESYSSGDEWDRAMEREVHLWQDIPPGPRDQNDLARRFGLNSDGTESGAAPRACASSLSEEESVPDGWDPEAELRSQLAKLHLPQEDIDRIVAESLG